MDENKPPIEAPVFAGSTPIGQPDTVISSEPPASAGTLLKLVFSDPYRLGMELKRNATWWLPFVVGSVIAAVCAILTMDQVVALAVNAMKKSFAQQSTQMSADQMESIISMSTKSMKVMLPMKGVMGTLLASLIGALLLLFVCNLIVGATSKFKQLFAGLMWVSLIASLSEVLRTPIMLMRDTAEVFIGPALFLPPGTTTGFWFVLLSGLDFFAIWQILATGAMVAAMCNWSKSKGMVVVFSAYMIFLLAMSGLGSLGTSIQVH